MKKLRQILIICAFLCAVVLFGACGGQLSAPDMLNVDIDNVLTWGEVPMASTYEVEITSANNTPIIETDDGEMTASYLLTSRRATVDLSNSSRFRLEEGDYIIRIRALARMQNTSDSEWSQPYEFHKEYETGCTYVLVNNGTEYEISRAGRATGDIVIEDIYRGKPVTGIADGAFRNVSRITGIVLGANVKRIGANAFNGCANLTSVTLPEGLETIDNAAFRGCENLTEIVIPDSVEYIGESAFQRCKSLTSITIGEGVITLKDYAFYDCSSVTELTVPDSVETVGSYAFAGMSALQTVNIGAGVQSLGGRTFQRCESLTKVNFAENSSLETVGTYAFENCTSLKSLAFPEGTLDIGDYCFMGSTQLAEVTLPATVEHVGAEVANDTKMFENAVNNIVYVGDWVADCTDYEGLIYVDEELLGTDARGIADFAFNRASSLQSVALPANIEIVGRQAFVSCQSLMTVNTVATRVIDYAAFANCINLTTLRLGEGLYEIGNQAFYGCSSLDNNLYNPTELIPSSVRRIGWWAFNETAMHAKARESQSVIYAGNWVVGSCDYPVVEDNQIKEYGLGTSVELSVDGEPVVGIADYTFAYQFLLENVTGLDDVLYLGKGAFYGCQSLSVATLSIDLIEIPDYCFAHCNNLFNVNMPSRLERIGQSAFYDATSLYTINIPDSVTEIGRNAFNACTSLTRVTLSDSLTEISDYAFFDCTRLSNIEIPGSVGRIGVKAFGRSGLSAVTLGENVTEIDYAAFYKTMLASVEIPDSVKTIANHAFYECYNLGEVKFGSGLESIGDYAFSGTMTLKDFYLPASLTHIGEYAFKGAQNVSSLTLPSSVAEIGSNAFFETSSLTIYTDAMPGEIEWGALWNSSGRPVIYGCVIEGEGADAYVASLTVTENTFENVRVVQVIVGEEGAGGGIIYDAVTNMNGPSRSGYTFAGWTTVPGSQTVEYTCETVVDAPIGTTLYSVWTKSEATEDPAPEEVPGEATEDTE